MLSPSSLASTQRPGELVGETVVVGNTGLGPLVWSLVGAPTDCSAPAPVPWLGFSPASGTTGAADSTFVAVTFDSTTLGAGQYAALLCLLSDDPLQPVLSIPVSMTVEQAVSVLEIPAVSAGGLAALAVLLLVTGLLVLGWRRSTAKGGQA